MIEPIKISRKPTVSDFFGYLFYVRDKTHLLHLATKSYAQHVALGEFYDSLLGFTDSLLESVQGEQGILNIVIPSSDSSGDANQHLTHCLKYVRDNRPVFKNTWEQSEIDILEKMILQTIYKLKNLK